MAAAGCSPLARSACSKRSGFQSYPRDPLPVSTKPSRQRGHWLPGRSQGHWADHPSQVRCRRRQARDLRPTISSGVPISSSRPVSARSSPACWFSRWQVTASEMFVGGLQDPAFGPVIFCGSGGVLVELFGDAACRLCPISDRDAVEMLNDIRGVARLRGHRGQPVGDEAALRDVVLRVAALLHACPEIQEMDVNPLMVRSQGVIAVDVRIRVDAPAPTRSTRRVRY